MMKLVRSLLLIMLVLAVSIGLATACAKNDEPVPTEEPVVTEAPEPTEAPTPTDEPTPTPEPTPAPTPKPALGENKGKPFADDMAGVDVLFSENFDDKDVDEVLEDAGAIWGPEHMEVIDGKLCLAFADGAPENNHQSYYPILDDDFTNYEQFEMSFDYKAAYTAPDLKNYEWMGLMIGCFITEPTGRIATNVGDGIYIGINDKGSFPVYAIGEAGAAGGWPEGAMTFNYGQKNFFDEERHVSVVQTNDMKVYLYIEGELVCFLEITDTEVILYNAEGKKVRSKSNDPENQVGANMMLWTHCTGAIIDNLVVKAY